MVSRWRTLIAVALAVVLLDQWTKLLAVKHLTPAFVEAAAEAAGQRPPKSLGGPSAPRGPVLWSGPAFGRPDSAEEEDALLGSMSPLAQVGTFYRTHSPCLGRAIACPPVRVFEGFWDWRYAENPGAAWSIFARASPVFRRVFLCGVSLTACVFIILYFRKLSETQRVLIYALSMVLGGAIGNLIDRARLGYVVDFIDWYAGTHHWPTFNVADSAISSGVALLALNMLFDLRPKGHQGEAKTDSEPLASSNP